MGALLGVLALGAVFAALDADRSRASASPAVPATCVAALNPAPAPDPSPMRRASFTWTGNGGSGHKEWNYTSNWSGVGGACMFPCASTDDATISLCNFNVIFDAGRTIDDVTIAFSGSACASTFTGGGSTRTLICDTITISGDSGAEADAGVRMVEGAGIETN